MNSRGDRTREQVVEWEQMPMEFVYTAPFLYVIHYDSIEIMQVAENLGQRESCKWVFKNMILGMDKFIEPSSTSEKFSPARMRML